MHINCMNFSKNVKTEQTTVKIKYLCKDNLHLLKMISYTIAIAVFAFLTLLYVFLGRIRKVEAIVTLPNDTYEFIDYEQQGRGITPFLSWDEEEHLHLPIRLKVQYVSSYSFGRKLRPDEVYLTLTIKEKPAFIDSISVQRPDGTLLPSDYEEVFALTPNKGGANLNTSLVFYRTPHSLIEAPRLVEIELLIKIKGSRLLFFPIRFPLRGYVKKNITLYTGPVLGDLWLAIDPGTTATCIATGRSLTDIMLSNEGIMPSFISIDKKYNYKKGESLESLSQHEDIVRVGAYAKNIQDEESNKKSDFQTFQSIKKLLGYNDEKIINFENGVKLPLNGNNLTNLLVNGFLRNFRKHIEINPGKYAEILGHNKHFSPKRVVVAIPNNFTASKIQDIVNCFRDLNQFLEIRCIRESEAVLCYYVYNHRELHPSQQPLKDETVLVFDMGGATINITVADTFVRPVQGRNRYFIEVDGQLGYGIGGDTIDYCLARVFFEAIDEYPELKKFNPFEDAGKLKSKDPDAFKRLKQDVKDAMEELKHILVREAGNKSRTFLLQGYEIEAVFNKYFGVSLSINTEGALYRNFKKTELGILLLYHPLFIKYVVKPVEDSIDDIGKLSELRFLDTVIFSGRSTLFPGIKEIVRQKVQKLAPPGRKLEFISLDRDELKTAVVKGACVYAVNRNAVSLSQNRVSCHFGIRHTLSMDKGNFDFMTIIPIGAPMDGHKIVNQVPLNHSRFEFDNQKVDFFQIMGAHPKTILQNLEKHKYSKLGVIDVSRGGAVEYVGMELMFDDTVKGYVIDSSSAEVRPGYRLNTAQKNQEIADANEEHYTWIVN